MLERVATTCRIRSLKLLDCRISLTKAGGKGSKEAIDDSVEGEEHSQSQNEQCCSKDMSGPSKQISR